MPLRVDVRKDTGTLWITGTVKPAGAKTGRRVRQRAGSNEYDAAREEAVNLENQILRDFYHGTKPSVYTFTEACESYLKHQDRSAGTKAVVRRLALHFKSTSLGNITQEAVDKARPKLLQPGAGDATWRKTVAILSAVMNHAARRKWCEKTSFDLPRSAEGRTKFLLPKQYEQMEASASNHIKPLLRYLVCTGSRLGEALSLDWSQVDLHASRVNVWADQTKGGKRRVVDLTPAAVAALAGLPHREGRVFRTHRGEPYSSSDAGGGQLRVSWGAACEKSGIGGRWVEWKRSDRPSTTKRFVAEIGPHDLRHTWATWWYELTPDPIRLQIVGGWSSVLLVTRYAHLMPAGHAQAIRKIWGISKHDLKVIAG